MKPFQRIQADFIRHLRNPGQHPPLDDVDDRRQGIYRDLVFNNIAGFIAGAFPVLKSVYADGDWQQLVRDFIADHRAQTPCFLRISEEFLDYLQTVRGCRPGDPPFLLELAHYEWVELALDVMDCELPAASMPLTADAGLQVSPLAWCLAYTYPVHQLSRDFQPQQPGESPSLLVVYRNRADAVKFMTLNALSFGVLQYLDMNPGLTAMALLEGYGQHLRESGAEQLPPDWSADGQALLRMLVDHDIVLINA